jgi:hypothetical protein
MFSLYKRPFGPPNAVIYSYELSKLFLGEGLTSILEVGCGIVNFCLSLRFLGRRPLGENN